LGEAVPGGSRGLFGLLINIGALRRREPFAGLIKGVSVYVPDIGWRPEEPRTPFFSRRRIFGQSRESRAGLVDTFVNR